VSDRALPGRVGSITGNMVGGPTGPEAGPRQAGVGVKGKRARLGRQAGFRPKILGEIVKPLFIFESFYKMQTHLNLKKI
jgi:hypothetical protein